METREYISPEATAKLELDAATERLARARAALADFLAEHTVLVDGRQAWKTERIDQVAGLWREQHTLLVQIDEAHRLWQEALREWKQFQPHASCIADGARR